MKQYHYFYKITNNHNGKFYYGVHSTNNLNDGYMGSGVAIRKAYEKYGIDNFTKEIVKFFDTDKQAYEYERLIVDSRMIHDKNSYNLCEGGHGGGEYIHQTWIPVKDKQGNIFRIDPLDIRWTSGELKHITKGLVSVVDNKGNTASVPIDDPRYINGELVGVNTNMIVVRDKNNGIIRRITKYEYESNRDKYEGCTKGKVTTRDKDGNIHFIDKDDPLYGTKYQHVSKNLIVARDKDGNICTTTKDDPRWISGELVGITKGLFTVFDKNGNKYQITKDDPRWISGELTFKTKGQIWINKEGQSKHINPDDLQIYLNNGWCKGRGKLKHI